MTDKNFERLCAAIDLLGKIHLYVTIYFWAYVLVRLYTHFFGTIVVLSCAYGYWRLGDWVGTKVANWRLPPRKPA